MLLVTSDAKIAGKRWHGRRARHIERLMVLGNLALTSGVDPWAATTGWRDRWRRCADSPTSMPFATGPSRCWTASTPEPSDEIVGARLRSGR